MIVQISQKSLFILFCEWRIGKMFLFSFLFSLLFSSFLFFSFPSKKKLQVKHENLLSDGEKAMFWTFSALYALCFLFVFAVLLIVVFFKYFFFFSFLFFPSFSFSL